MTLPTRRLGVLGLVLAVLGLLLPVASVQGAAPEMTWLSPCYPTGPVDTVAGLNRFARSAAGVEGFRGADIGVDVLLPDGRRLWFFGDTLQSASGEDDHLVRNSILVTVPGCARLVEVHPDESPIPDRSDGVGYWPMSAFHTGDEVYVLAQRVRTISSDPWGFEILGSSVAVFTVPDRGPPVLSGVTDLGADQPDPSEPVWGAAIARAGGWVYIYATSTRPLAGTHGFALRVARTRPSDLADRSAWVFWDGMSWTPDEEQAVAVIGEVGGVSQTLSVFRSRGRWWALSKRNEFLGTDLAVWPATRPQGPFGAPDVLFRIPCGDPGEVQYMPLAHPELLPRPGTVVVSWSRNNLDLAAVCSDPTLYRPEFRRVRLPDVG